LRQRSDDLMLGRVAYDGLFFQRDTTTGRYEDLAYGHGYEGPSLNYRKVEKLEKDPLFFAWLTNPLFERVCRGWIEGDVTLYRAVLMNKASQGGTVLPWHQDGGRFWGLDRDPMLQIWTALDDAPIEAGCVEFLPGTHRGGLATPLGGVVPVELVEREAARTPVRAPVKAGSALLIHNHVWHRSGVNRTASPRRAFSVCYMSAATRCLRVKRAPRIFQVAFKG
jgi:phytanoyl-CoA hydroxylase